VRVYFCSLGLICCFYGDSIRVVRVSVLRVRYYGLWLF